MQVPLYNYLFKPSGAYRFAFWLAIVLYCIVVSRGVYLVIAGTEYQLVQAIADDGLYYWMIAKNLAQNGMSSFDGGMTLTSGYHPLWAWILIPFAALQFPEIVQLKLFVLISVTVSAVAGGLLLEIIVKRKEIIPLLVYSVMLSSYSWMTNSIAGLEWPIVLLINILVFKICMKNTPGDYVPLFILGVLGSLARSDFGAVPAIL